MPHCFYSVAMHQIMERRAGAQKRESATDRCVMALPISATFLFGKKESCEVGLLFVYPHLASRRNHIT